MNKKAINASNTKTNSNAQTVSAVPRQVPKVIAKRSRRKSPNDDVCNERRQQLLELILKTNSIRRAANELKINNSTAKSIFYKYKQTGQIDKNPRVRNTRDGGDKEPSEDNDCAMNRDEDAGADNDEESNQNKLSM